MITGVDLIQRTIAHCAAGQPLSIEQSQISNCVVMLLNVRKFNAEDPQTFIPCAENKPCSTRQVD